MTDDEYELELHDEVSRYYDNPHGFIMFAFEWGKGDLTGFDGPDQWQINVMSDIGDQVRARKFDGVNAVDPIQLAVSSGHG